MINPLGVSAHSQRSISTGFGVRIVSEPYRLDRVVSISQLKNREPGRF
jgi:hypothetical protein